jgi:hypothetical protein
MNALKYRLEYKIGRLELSSPCNDEIEVLQKISELDADSFQILQYFPVEQGAKVLDLRKIGKKQFMLNLMAVIFNKNKK